MAFLHDLTLTLTTSIGSQAHPTVHVLVEVRLREVSARAGVKGAGAGRTRGGLEPGGWFLWGLHIQG